MVVHALIRQVWIDIFMILIQDLSLNLVPELLIIFVSPLNLLESVGVEKPTHLREPLSLFLAFGLGQLLVLSSQLLVAGLKLDSNGQLLFRRLKVIV